MKYHSTKQGQKIGMSYLQNKNLKWHINTKKKSLTSVVIRCKLSHKLFIF